MIRPLGSRILVKDVVSTLSVEVRASKIGLTAIVSEADKPKPTTGIVIAIGTDPLLRANVAVGDLVSFSYLAGTGQIIDDEEYRALDFMDIISVDDGDTNAKDRLKVLNDCHIFDGRIDRAERDLARLLDSATGTNGDGEGAGGEPSAEAGLGESGDK